MRSLTFIYLLLFIVIVSGCSKAVKGSSKLVAVEVGQSRTIEYYKNISPRMLKKMIDSDDSFILADVRTEKEYKSGHIKGAKHLPISEVEHWYKTLNKADKIVVYCLGGVRSVEVSEKLLEKGFKSVYNMEGGISEWKYETFK